MLVTEYFQAEAGGHGGHDLQQSRRNRFRYERKRASDFGANFAYELRFSSLYQHQIKIPSLVLVIAAKHGLDSYAANIPFLNSLYSDEHSVRDRTVPVRAVER